MSALLRNGAARRLGGSVLQRTKAALTSPAVAEERRRLVPRRMFATEKIEKHPDEVLREIKKEELYDAIATVDDSCRTFANMRLHQHLAAEIAERKNDYVWKKYYTARTFRLLKKVGILTLPFTVPTFWEYCRSCFDDEKGAPAMMREEDHKAISCSI